MWGLTVWATLSQHNIFVPVYGLVGETCRCFVAGKRAIFVSNDYKPNDKAKKRPSAC